MRRQTNSCLAHSWGTKMAVLSRWCPGTLTEPNQRDSFIAEAASARCFNVLVFAHPIRVVYITATSPSGAPAYTTRRTRASDRATFAEDLWLILGIEVGRSRVRWAPSSSSKTRRIATGDSDALETSQTGNAIGPLSLSRVMVMWKVAAMTILDGDRGQFRHGSCGRIGGSGHV